MLTLVVDDEQEKRDRIIACISEVVGHDNLIVRVAESLSVAASMVSQIAFDLIVLDLMLPLTEGGAVTDVTKEVVSLIAQNRLNSKTSVVAITRFSELLGENEKSLKARGIVLLHYDELSGLWKEAIAAVTRRVTSRPSLDFAIICALEEERSAYGNTTAICGTRTTAQGFDEQSIKIGDYNGVCILLSGMGLVTASATTARVIDVLKPKVLAISGICGGFERNTSLGCVLVGNPCWEYQSGKWSSDGFKIEPYPVELTEDVRLAIKSVIDQRGILDVLEADLDVPKRPSVRRLPMIVPFASGSAVLASADKLAPIEQQHRKVAGLDMEMYGVYRAARLSGAKGLKVFGAKVVVDLADSGKDDGLHPYGSAVAARFTVLVIERLLEKYDE